MENPLITGTLSIEVKGEVVASNVSQFREMVKTALAGINLDLRTDEDFGEAETNVKGLVHVEQVVKSAKDKALADAEALHALFTELDDTAEDVRVARLDLEKKIKSRKDEVKRELIEEALARYDIDPGVARAKLLPGLEIAIKGKRTVESMRKALNTEVLTRQGLIHKSREILDRFEKAHGTDLIMDRRDLELLRADQVESELRRRFEVNRAQKETERLRIEAEQEKERRAKEEADRATAAKEANAPPPPPTSHVVHGQTGFVLTSEPQTAPRADDVADEWRRFLDTCMECFGPLKVARQALRHPENSEKALRFAQAINAAWKEVSA